MILESKVMRFEDGLGRTVQREFEPSEVDGILKMISERAEVIPGSVFAYVYGSFIAEGASRDIDVAIYFGETPHEAATEHCLEANDHFNLVKAEKPPDIIDLILKHQSFRSRLGSHNVFPESKVATQEWNIHR